MHADVSRDEPWLQAGYSEASHRLRLRQVAPLLSEALSAVAVRNVLDVGANSGWFFEQLAIPAYTKRSNPAATARCVGVECRESLLQHSENRYDLRICARGEALPFEDQSFDLCTLFDMLSTADNKQEVIDEAWRVLAPGGVLFIESVLQLPLVYHILRDTSHLLKRRRRFKSYLRLLLWRLFGSRRTDVVYPTFTELQALCHKGVERKIYRRKTLGLFPSASAMIVLRKPI